MTLTSARVAPLLARLFKEGDESMKVIHEMAKKEEFKDMREKMKSKTEYIQFYAQFKDFALAVSPATGQLMYMLARSSGARSIVEFGTSFGISTIHLAAALRDNGGGKVITAEFEPSKVERATANLTEAGLMDLVEIRQGDALQTFSTNLPPTIDIVLLDGAKAIYLDVLRLLENHFKPGTLIVADNADNCPEYLAHVRSQSSGYTSLPFTDDVELSMRV
eukprot:Phypoly_transcript_15070.p1 GENE.Phypoly_transcript_15070~~Phypoly_transcript_15070.p1  ORF type:complete len:220 (-),score=35.67 Phypoly_transcript_15070:81-740(-)